MYKKYKERHNFRKRLIIIFLGFICISFLLDVILMSNNRTEAAISWGYYTDNFNTSCPIKLSGSAFYTNKRINLAKNSTWQAGAAFSNEKIEEETGFSTYFCLSTDGYSNRRADGFCIILSKDTNVVNYSTLRRSKFRIWKYRIEHWNRN